MSGFGDDVLEYESRHGTQSTYHAQCGGVGAGCSSGPGRLSIPGKLIVIKQVTETEQGLADNHLSPLFPSSSSSILFCFPDAFFYPEAVTVG